MISIHTSKDQTFYLLILGNLVVLALLGMFVLRPIFGSMATHTKALTATRSETTAIQQNTTQLRQLKQNYPAVEAQYAPILASMPKTKDTAGYQTELEALAQLTSVSLKQVDTTDGAATGNAAGTAAKAGTPTTVAGFPVIPVKVTMSGSYASIADFLNRVETMDRFTRVTGLTLTSASGAGDVQAQASLQTFYFPN